MNRKVPIVTNDCDNDDKYNDYNNKLTIIIVIMLMINDDKVL